MMKRSKKKPPKRGYWVTEIKTKKEHDDDADLDDLVVLIEEHEELEDVD